MELNFEIEWLDAPGVRDRVLAATWARLRISVAGKDVTELIHLASDTRRAAVYGSVFPLVEWALENWWHLLHEPRLTPRVTSGRDPSPWEREWVQRHALLAAREGGALPDALFVRDGDEVLVRWFPDSQADESHRVRFVGEGSARIPALQLEQATRELIESTLERLREVVGDTDEDFHRAFTLWTAIESADAEERELCRALALLGADPYDTDETPDDLVERVREVLVELPPTLRDDLLHGARPDTFERSAHWLRDQVATILGPTTLGPTKGPTVPTVGVHWLSSAHDTGYDVARRVRKELFGVSEREALPDLRELLVDKLGWSDEIARAAGLEPRLDALVGLSAQTGKPLLVESGKRGASADRFRLARAAFFTSAGLVDGGRLLTRAATRDQRAGRAFAAELLVPAAALARRVSGPVSEEEVADLANEYDVAPLVIEHQLENHRIGSVAG